MTARSGHFAHGAGLIDLYHVTSADSAAGIQRTGFHASYEDSAHFVDNPDAARTWGNGSVVHIRARASDVEYHGLGPGAGDKNDTKYYGVKPDEDGPGHLDASTVHCVDGPCTRGKR